MVYNTKMVFDNEIVSHIPNAQYKVAIPHTVTYSSRPLVVWLAFIYSTLDLSAKVSPQAAVLYFLFYFLYISTSKMKPDVLLLQFILFSIVNSLSLSEIVNLTCHLQK